MIDNEDVVVSVVKFFDGLPSVDSVLSCDGVPSFGGVPSFDGVAAFVDGVPSDELGFVAGPVIQANGRLTFIHSDSKCPISFGDWF